MRLKQKTRKIVTFYSLVAPWFIVFIILGLFPLLYGFYLSFTNYYGFNMSHLRFVGLHNYAQVFTDNEATYAMYRTFVYSIISVPLGTAIALLLALLLNVRIRGLGFFRTAFYLPSIMPAITTIFIFKNLVFSSNGGFLNNILEAVGLPDVNWLGYNFCTSSLIIMSAWGAGGGILLFIAGLKGIPSELYEAAAIDGATPTKSFFRITVPLITPVIFFNIVMGLIGSFQMYMQPILLNGSQLLSHPLKPNYLYAVHAFQQIFGFQRFSYGMALLWVLFVVILFFSCIVFITSKYWVYSESSD